MGIIDIIRASLWNDKDGGLNQSEIARKYNLSQQTVNRIFHDKINLEKLEIRTFVRMFPNAELILNERLGDNPPDTVYPLIDQPELARVDTLEQQPDDLSLFDRAMLEEWGKLDQQDKCRVMGFMAQLDKEKKSDRATTA